MNQARLQPGDGQPKFWRQLLESFAGKRVLVVGDVMVDDYLHGDLEWPGPGEPVTVAARRRESVPGGAANAAANLAALGARVALGGLRGGDAAGELLSSLVGRSGVATGGLVADPARPTTVKLRLFANGSPLLRLDTERAGPLHPDQEEALARWAEERMPGCDACLLSDYGKGVVTPRLARRTLAAARRCGRPVVVDPKGTDYAKYRGATVVKPNLREAAAFCHRPLDDEAALAWAGERLAGFLPGTAVLLTRGSEGMSLFRLGRAPVHLPAHPVGPVCDVTGAGDTVAATLTLALACEVPLLLAANLANLAAGLVLGKPGTAVVTRQELAEALSRQAEGSSRPPSAWPDSDNDSPGSVRWWLDGCGNGNNGCAGRGPVP